MVFAPDEVCVPPVQLASVDGTNPTPLPTNPANAGNEERKTTRAIKIFFTRGAIGGNRCAWTGPAAA
jgi:hypothetical protein